MEKTIYEAPSTKILQVRVQGMIMNSNRNATAPAKMDVESADIWGDWE